MGDSRRISGIRRSVPPRRAGGRIPRRKFACIVRISDVQDQGGEVARARVLMRMDWSFVLDPFRERDERVAQAVAELH